MGRTLPDLNLIKVTKQKSRQYTRHFTIDYDSKYIDFANVMLEILFFVFCVFYLTEKLYGQKLQE